MGFLGLTQSDQEVLVVLVEDFVELFDVLMGLFSIEDYLIVLVYIESFEKGLEVLSLSVGEEVIFEQGRGSGVGGRGRGWGWGWGGMLICSWFLYSSRIYLLESCINHRQISLYVIDSVLQSNYLRLHLTYFVEHCVCCQSNQSSQPEHNEVDTIVTLLHSLTLFSWRRCSPALSELVLRVGLPRMEVN